MRRRPGIGGLQTAAAARDQYRALGENVAKLRTDLMKEQLATFRSQLEEFARKHKNDIRKNPTFRAQFHEMCAKVGVDPLASHKGFWAELLGIGDFYYELGLQIIDICMATRPQNGGLINLQELCTMLRQKRKSDREAVSEDDCLRAISKLKQRQDLRIRMRRRPGIGGLQTAAAARDQYRALGENVAKLRTDLMKEQLATFRSQLEEFARKHKNDIRKNPTFRAQFHEMCAKVGVDPLASHKGFWAELLGIGDFYYELGLQIIDICMATRPQNGGLINLQELCTMLRQKRKSDREAVSEDDCLRAISKLKMLGNGFEVISVGKRKLVRSVPTELNKDHNAILELAQAQGFVTVDEVERRLSWTSGRAIDALDTLLDEGLAMIDDGHSDGRRRYWFPCESSLSSSVGIDM